MSRFSLLRKYLPGNREADEAPYRCLRCGEGIDDDYHDCPACGAPMVVETNPPDESES